MITLKYWVERLLYGKGLATLLRAYRTGKLICTEVDFPTFDKVCANFTWGMYDPPKYIRIVSLTHTSEQSSLKAVRVYLFDDGKLVHEFYDSNYYKLIDLVKRDSLRNSTLEEKNGAAKFDEYVERNIK